MNYKKSKIVSWFETASLDYIIPFVNCAGGAAIPLDLKRQHGHGKAATRKQHFMRLLMECSNIMIYTAWRPRLFSTGLVVLLAQASENHFFGKIVLGTSYPLGWQLPYGQLAGLVYGASSYTYDKNADRSFTFLEYLQRFLLDTWMCPYIRSTCELIPGICHPFLFMSCSFCCLLKKL